MKGALAHALARMIGYSIRHSGHTTQARNFLTQRIYEPYFAWRKLSVISPTQFGARMRLQLPDSIQTAIFLTGEWDAPITGLIESRLGPGDVFIDVGANIGYFSLLASRKVGSAGKVYAFEASPSVFEHLQSNLTLNQAGNVTPLNVAVSNGPGTCSIWTAPEGNIGHSTIMDNVALHDGHSKEATVRCDSLHALVPYADLLNARIIKVDIEGAERLMVEGIVPHLNNFSPATEWIIELSPEFSPGGFADVAWIFECFAEAGYAAYLIERNNDAFQPDGSERVQLTQITTAPQTRLNDVLFSKMQVFGPRPHPARTIQ